MVATGNKNELVRLGEKNHSQMKTSATLHNGSAEFSDSRAPVCMRVAKNLCCVCQRREDFFLVGWLERFSPLAKGGGCFKLQQETPVCRRKA